MGAGSSAALGRKSTAVDVVRHFAGTNARFLEGRVAVITGGNGGIGLETAKALAYAGCRVLIGSRTVAAGEAAIEREILGAGLGGYSVEDAKSRVAVAQLELESPKSIRAFAAVAAAESRIDFLIFNAGIMALPTCERTPLGFERQIGVNHFGHFQLMQSLRAKMEAQAFPSRVVVVSSLAHNRGSVVVDDLHFEKGRKYNDWVAYGQSKMANILFTKELADQLVGTQVTAVCLHPGVIQTNLARHIPMVQGAFGKFVFENFIVDKSIPQGAATTLYGCLEPSLTSQAGSYLFDCAVVEPNEEGRDAAKTKRKALWAATVAQLEAAMQKFPDA